MDDGSFASDSSFSDILGAKVDMDFMDELLNEGCWLKTADEFDSSQTGPLTCSIQSDPSHCFPRNDHNSGSMSINLYEDPVENKPESQNCVESSTSLVQSAFLPVRGNEFEKGFWIGPGPSLRPYLSVKERLVRAIKQLKYSTKQEDSLIQIWVPIKKGGKQVLTTVNQPYLLDPNSHSLASYRNVSESYNFSAEKGSKDFFGLPGRVFLEQLPEWTPDVRFFRSDEYPRKSYAQQYNICGSLAVPVFEQGSGSCLGVIEVVTTMQKISYRPELENICQALEAVNLHSSHDFTPPSVKACKEFCQAQVPELSEILESVCMSHRLPLALTWAPCFRHGKGGCRHFDEKYAHCISTVDSACFVAKEKHLGFHVACSEQYLNFGQGIVGRAFTSNKQCFSSDIAAFCKTDYPLSHHAKLFNLHAAVAIPLRTYYPESPDFVLEFFLPNDIRDTEEQKHMQDLLSNAIQQACQTLHVIMDKELDGDFNPKEPVAKSKTDQKEESPQDFTSPSFEKSHNKEPAWVSDISKAQQKGKGLSLSGDCTKEEREEEFKMTTHWETKQEEVYPEQIPKELGHHQKIRLQASIEGGNSSLGGNSCMIRSKTTEKRRTKTEKTISLQVLRQYFAGSLKDAAKNLGVCPTTLKRICRQHGITRWPSRKIKKVGHSLRKLQLVIDSVQGAEGTIQIGSFYTAFPDLTSPNRSANGPVSSFIITDDSKQLNPQHENGIFSIGAITSQSPSTSSSRSSGSSIDFSASAKPTTTKNVSTGGEASVVGGPAGSLGRAHASEEVLMVEDPHVVLKRTRSNAELQTLNHEVPTLIARSQSHVIVNHEPNLVAMTQYTKRNGNSLPDGGAFRVNATFGEDKMRFSLQPMSGFKELLQEIAKRFNIDDGSNINLKYLDDDNEWVLLTCNEDLEECRDIHQSCMLDTIRISVHHSSQQPLGSSLLNS